MNQLPAKEHVQSEPKGLLKLIRNVLPAAEPPAPSGSSAAGSSSYGVAGRDASSTSSHHSGTTVRLGDGGSEGGGVFFQILYICTYIRQRHTYVRPANIIVPGTHNPHRPRLQ